MNKIEEVITFFNNLVGEKITIAASFGGLKNGGFLKSYMTLQEVELSSVDNTLFLIGNKEEELQFTVNAIDELIYEYNGLDTDLVIRLKDNSELLIWGYEY